MNEIAAEMPMYETQTKKSGGFGFLISLVVLGITIAYGAQLYFAQNSLSGEIEKRNASISMISNAIKTMQATDKVSDRLVANQILQKINAETVTYSVLTQELMKLEDLGVEFTSISNGKGSEIRVSAEAEDYATVGTIIDGINASAVLKESFVESAVQQKISVRKAGASAPSTKRFVQFNMTFDYENNNITTTK